MKKRMLCFVCLTAAGLFISTFLCSCNGAERLAVGLSESEIETAEIIEATEVKETDFLTRLQKQAVSAVRMSAGALKRQAELSR